MTSLIDEFFAYECDAYVRRLLLHEIDTRTSGSKLFTFDRFNVILDMNTGLATLEDELEPDSSEELALSDFAARLRRLGSD